jgi:hypothetical protein
VQEADHPQKIEKTEEEGRKAPCEFGEIGENCDFIDRSLIDPFN